MFKVMNIIATIIFMCLFIAIFIASKEDKEKK